MSEVTGSIKVTRWEEPLTLYVKGAWKGWNGHTVVTLTDGSRWKQAEYHYEYRYAYRPEAVVLNGSMFVQGMTRAVRVRKVH